MILRPYTRSRALPVEAEATHLSQADPIGGVPLRFLNLGNRDLAIDYSFIEARNLIIITTSRASIFSTIDKVIGQ